MSAHTPGPWAAKPFAGNWNVWSKKGKPDSSAVAYDCAPADARLIAAAPELLEALRAIADQEQHDGNAEAHMHDMADIARDAIKKATEA